MPLRTQPLQGRPRSHLSLLARHGSQLIAFLDRLAGLEDEDGMVGDGGEWRLREDGSMAGDGKAEEGKWRGTGFE